jgi:hypothetical protein
MAPGVDGRENYGTRLARRASGPALWYGGARGGMTMRWLMKLLAVLFGVGFVAGAAGTYRHRHGVHQGRPCAGGRPGGPGRYGMGLMGLSAEDRRRVRSRAADMFEDLADALRRPPPDDRAAAPPPEHPAP